MDARTTEELFAVLTPEAREEAVRLAARLQEENNEGGHLIAAAYEVGVEERHLREAATRLGNRRSSARSVATSNPSQGGVVTVPTVLGFCVMLAQLYQVRTAYDYGSVANVGLLLSTFLVTVLFSVRARWWVGIALVICVWTTMVPIVHLSIAGRWAAEFVARAEAKALSLMLLNLAAVGLGTLVGLTGAAVNRMRAPRSHPVYD